MSDMQIAETILAQLGGRRFTSMTGAKDIYAIKSGVQFKVGRNCKGVNKVRITLNAADTYDMQFLFVRGMTVKVKSSTEGIYADQLQVAFTEHTGLYTHL
jgi:hypothetical protein